MEEKAPVSLWIAAVLLEGDDYERAVERALKLIETHERVLAERAKRKIVPDKNWSRGIREITGDEHLRRAERKFMQFWENIGEWFMDDQAHARAQGIGLGVIRTLEDWRKTGFTDSEVARLKYQFDQLPERQKKISEKVLGRPKKPKKARTGPV